MNHCLNQVTMLLCVRFSCFVPAKTALLCRGGRSVGLTLGWCNIALGKWPCEGTARCEDLGCGIVRFETSEVDESALTGESVPVPKKHGSKVVGDPLNHAGSIKVRLSDVGERSAMARTAKLVKKRNLESARAGSRRQNSFTFVPAVISVAAVACSLTWRHVQRFNADPVAPCILL